VRNALIIAGAVIVLVAANVTIFQKQELLANGRVVLLELAPVDPRSLMQGDYMALRFKATTEAFASGDRRVDRPDDGRLVLKIDEHSVGRFARFDEGQALAPGEIVVRYRVRNHQMKVATDAFFFQEGHASLYSSARYGEFRVAAGGEAILTAMRDANFQLLGPPR